MGYGKATSDLLANIYARGIDHAVLLMRHSAREYDPEKHDLDNPLTNEGREYARILGADLPNGLTARGYASPSNRCMETADLVLEGYKNSGGTITRNRPVEGLGIFYVLDQMKMWRFMTDLGGLAPFVDAWFRGEVTEGVMIKSDQAANIILGILSERLDEQTFPRQLDVCVSHDITLYLMRNRLLGQGTDRGPVHYLDAVAAYMRDGSLWLETSLGPPVRVR